MHDRTEMLQPEAEGAVTEGLNYSLQHNAEMPIFFSGRTSLVYKIMKSRTSDLPGKQNTPQENVLWGWPRMPSATLMTDNRRQGVMLGGEVCPGIRQNIQQCYTYSSYF